MTLIAQPAPKASELPQVLLSANALALVPVSEIPVTDSAAVPEFVSVTICAADVAPLFAVKTSGPGGVNVTAATAGAVAVPVRLTVCGEPVALSAIDSVAM